MRAPVGRVVRAGLAVFAGLYLVVTAVAWLVQRQVVWPMSVEERVDRPAPPGAGNRARHVT